MSALLQTRDMTMDFGGLRAVDHVNIQVDEGEIVALIGPNGAGKTTVFNCITGMHPPTDGQILIAPPGGDDQVITRLPAHKITKRGLARTFQNIRLFQNMTVLENVMIGRHCRLHAGILGAVLRDPRTRAEEQQVVDDSYQILTKIGLEGVVNEFAKNLAYAAQRRLEIARALATDPFLLLLDEPAAGMNPRETQDLNELILKLREQEDLTIFLIEHDMSLVMSLSERIYVMDYGRLIAEGAPEDIKRNHDVITAYLGEDIDA